MKDSIENTEQQLEALADQLFRHVPSKTDSPLRLLASARLCAAFYRFITINNNDDRYGNRQNYTHRAEVLFRRLFCSASSRKTDFTERARLVSALYFLSTEAMPFYDVRREELAGEALARLMEDLPGLAATEAVVQPLVCRCLASYFYPELDSDDDRALYLFNTVRSWAGMQSVDGVWEGLPAEVALARIEAMNSYSYLFLDTDYDAQIRQACNYYMPLFSANGFGRGNESLHALACRYDLSLQGNACKVDWKTADAAAAAFYQRSRHYSAGSDEWYYCLSIYAVHLCEQITDYFQHEMQSIA